MSLPGRAAPAGNASPLHFTLPSALPVGNAVIDTIHFQWLDATSDRLAVGGRLPAVIIVPGLGDTDNSPQDQRAARYLTRRGIDCAIILLPYSGHRLIDGREAQDYFLSRDASVVAQAMLQSASDIETVRAWVASQPDVDPGRIGVIGWSEGAIIIHLAMGLYPEIRTGVAIGGGGDLADLRQRTLLLLPQRISHPFDTTPKQIAILSKADPLTYAMDNRPRHVLMIEGARDKIVPPHDIDRLWHALGEPPIRWADMGHVGLGWTERPELEAGYAYFIQNWAMPGMSDPPVPQVNGQLIKLGFVAMTHSQAVLALQDQMLGFGHKSDHTALFGLNIGISTSRPFAALGYTADHYIDIGIAMRLGDHAPQAYISTYFPF